MMLQAIAWYAVQQEAIYCLHDDVLFCMLPPFLMKRRWEHQKKIRLNSALIMNWRLQKQLSQRLAAKACGVSEVTYRRIEHGKGVEILTAARMAKHLRISVDELKLKS